MLPRSFPSGPRCSLPQHTRLLLFYFIGVSKVLQQLGVIKPGVTKVAGTSGGIIGCAPDFGLVDHETFLKVRGGCWCGGWELDLCSDG